MLLQWGISITPGLWAPSTTFGQVDFKKLNTAYKSKNVRTISGVFTICIVNVHPEKCFLLGWIAAMEILQGLWLRLPQNLTD
jgi:hypothetical protein